MKPLIPQQPFFESPACYQAPCLGPDTSPTLQALFCKETLQAPSTQQPVWAGNAYSSCLVWEFLQLPTSLGPSLN